VTADGRRICPCRAWLGNGLEGGAVADVKVIVEGASDVGELEPIWMSFGYDELNWTATPRGRANTAALREVFGGPVTVRAHNLLTSGNGRALPHWSSGNVYHEDGQGNPVYDWSQADAAFDVWVENDMVPIVELGFCPVQRSYTTNGWRAARAL
jgi:xylan 1,4-beta-xylosidase